MLRKEKVMRNTGRRKQKRYYKCLTIIIAAFIFIQSISAENYVNADLIGLEKVRKNSEIILNNNIPLSNDLIEDNEKNIMNNHSVKEVQQSKLEEQRLMTEEVVPAMAVEDESSLGNMSKANHDEANREKTRKPRSADDIIDKFDDLGLASMALTGAQNHESRMADVSVESYAFEGNGDNPNVVRPNDNMGIRTSIMFNIPNGHRRGDYFTFKFDDNINPGGTNIHFIAGNIVHPKTNEIIATPEYDPITKTIKYTFTDYVEKTRKCNCWF